MLNLNKIIDVMCLMRNARINEEEAFNLANEIVQNHNLATAQKEIDMDLIHYAKREFVKKFGQWNYEEGLSNIAICRRKLIEIMDGMNEDTEEIYSELELISNCLFEAEKIFMLNQKK